VVTLPYRLGGSTAVFTVSGDPGIRLHQEGKDKARRAAEATLCHLGLSHLGGVLSVECDLPTGRGFGSSTADVTATIRAVAAACGAPLGELVIAKLAVQAESASDGVMFERPHLFGNRTGQVLDWASRQLPPIRVVGFDACPGCPAVLTDQQSSPAYTQRELGTFRVLRAAMRRAIDRQDAALLGQVATASARINQARNPLPLAGPIFDRLGELPVLGVQVAHSGTVAGLILDPFSPRTGEHTRALKNELRALGVRKTWVFDVVS
jgi:uncharacterized protein involved in propanediol utilization